MNPRTLPGTLVQEIARAVADLPDVAFLRPGLAGRLRSAFSRTDPDTGPADGVRVTRRTGGAGWQVEIQLVARSRARTADVARAARSAAEERIAAALPDGRDDVRVTVVVTGLV
ncbi:hypothetical protein GTW43_33425 [Streptomyces sp. SID5785]|uniref:hypothetical protein n=1 Tax=Streptomyces sp. SID5785 TaxID=2690309 RepID=UPI001361628E|nr:hypothetical protein [Streptomyces sp. SID5785]MZD09947.1 hypothetical protein [Streptomyces sp. SID5785]